MNNQSILIHDVQRLLKASDVARILNISRALSYQLMQSGKIPVIKFNRTVRVKPSDLESFILQNRNGNEEQRPLST